MCVGFGAGVPDIMNDKEKIEKIKKLLDAYTYFFSEETISALRKDEISEVKNRKLIPMLEEIKLIVES